MTPRLPLALTFFALVGGSAAAAPSAKVVKKAQPHKVGTVTLKRGLPRLQATSPAREDTRIEALERTPTELENPDNRGVFATTLRRTKTAKLTAKKPADRGVALVTLQGAASIPLYIGLREPGIHFFGSDKAWRYREGAALALSPAKLKGDDLAVSCRGDFAGTVDVAIMHLTTARRRTVEHSLNGSDGKIEFLVQTTGMADGLLVMTLTAPEGPNRLKKCTVSRE